MAAAPSDLEQRMLAMLGALTRELHPGLGERAFGLDDSLDADFGLDSLARVELLARVARELGVTLPEGAAFEAATPRDLLRLVPSATALPAPPLAQPLSPPLAQPVAPAPTRAAAAEHPPDNLATLLEVFDWHLEHHPERPLLTLYSDDAHTPAAALTYRDLWRAAQDVAAGLRARGISAGDTVAIMLPTGRDFFAAFYGTWLAGGVPVPLYPPARPAQLEEHLKRVAGIVANARARALLTIDRALPLAHFVQARSPALQFVSTVEAIAEPGAAVSHPALRGNDIALLQYTSGSTGDPKGVVLSHANLLASLRAMWRASGVTSADVFVSWLPLYHDMGLIGACLGSLYLGFPLVLMSPLAFLARPVRWLQAIDRHRGTLSAGPNFAYELCATKIADTDLAGIDLRTWRLAFNGAEPVSASTIERFADRFAACGFRRQAMTPVYGLAEASLGLTFPPPGRGPLIDRVERATLMHAGRAQPAAASDPHPLQVVSSGRPLPGHEVRIVGAGGRAVGERSEGRVQFRGPAATSGYLDNSAANAALFDGDWLESGDLGYLAAGELYLTGRQKDLIIRRGFNVHPQELEAAIAEVAGVRKGGVAVFPTSDPSGGTERLVVVAETHATAHAERLAIEVAIGHLTCGLLGMPPDDIVLVAPRTVLKTSSGKLRRAACRDLYERGAIEEPPPSVGWQMARLAAQTALARARRIGGSVTARLWSACAWAVFLAVGGFSSLAAALLPTPLQRRHAVRACARIGWRVLGVKVTVRGLEQLPRGPCVVVANHCSYADSVLLTAALPAHFVFAAKDELARSPLFGWPLRRIGTAFVARSADRRGLEDARALQARVQAGQAVVFYPEGTFQVARGLLPFALGAFAVASAAQVPIVPVAIQGSRALLPPDSRRVRRHPVTVTIGPALAPAGSNWRDVIALRDAARRALLDLTGEPDLATEFGPQRSVAAERRGAR